MDDLFSRRSGAIAVGLIFVCLVGAAMLLAGGQTRTILSTVGAAIPPHVGTGVGADTDPEAAPPDQQPAPGVVAAAGALAPAPGLLIVRTGTLRLETASVGEVVERATAVATTAGGYVASSKETGSAADRGARLDLRIPAEAWDRSLGGLRGLGTVLGQEIGTEEVTGQVIDLDARVGNLRATEAALQAIMVKATKIADVLDVQEQLTATRGEIEELTAKAASLRDRAAFGSLSLLVSVPPAAKPAASPRPGWDPARDVAEASGKLVRIGQTATSAGIWLGIIGIPIVLALGIGLLLLRLAWVVLRRTGLVGAREPA
ncbi:MAG: DUF4349 domain-containing protein [Chloroflexota bacterium]